MPVFNNILAGAAGSGGADAYEIERSLRFEPGDSAYLDRTPSSAGSNTTWTLSTWVKKTGNDNHIFGAGAGNTPGRFGFGFNGSDKIFAFIIASNSTVFSITTDAVFRDPAGWYHIVLIADTGNSTQADRFKIYVNGVLQSVSGTLMPSGQNTFVNTTAAHTFGRRSYTASDYFDGYLADVHFIDGQALAATDFGEEDDNGVWQPIEYAGTYDQLLDQSEVWSDNFVETTITNPTRAFNGNLAQGSQRAAVGSYVKWEAPTALSGDIVVYQSVTSGGASSIVCDLLAADNSTVLYTNTNSSVTNNGTVYQHSFSNTSGVKYVKVVENGGSSYTNFNGISVDGELLVDTGVSVASNGFHLDFSDNSSNAALGTDSSGNNNTWTVNNISTTSFDAVGNSSHVGPGNVTFFKPATYYNLFAIDTNNVSSNPGNAALARFNFSALGLTAPATITFDSYEQGGGGWTTVSSNIYTDAGTVTSSYTSSGNTRSNTVNIPAGATYFEIPGSYNSSVSAYSNGINNLVWGGTSYQHVGPEEIDSLIDTPTNYTASSGNNGGNYATWNPLGGSSSTYGTFSQGNLQASLPASGKSVFQTIFPQSGKWYVEIDFVSGGGAGGGLRMGIINENNINQDLGSTANSWAYLADGRTYHNGSAPSYGVSSAPGDKLMMALDIDAGKLWFGKDGTWMASGNPSAGTNPSHTFTAGQKMSFSVQSGGGTTQVVNANWGQRPWAYTPPTNFLSLCTQNLDDPLIADPSTAFDVLTWEGQSGSGSRDFRGLSFTPDLAWVKTRSQGYTHVLWDSVRGPGVNKELQTDNTNQEGQANTAVSGYIDAFVDGGFNTTAGTTDNDYFNRQSTTYVSWAWDAGDSNTSISAGSLNTSVYNTSRTWSDGIANQSSDFDQAATNAFNGNRSNKLRTSGNNVLVTLNFSPALTVASTIELLGEDAATADFNYTVTVDGTTTTKDVGQGQPATFNVSGSLTQITFSNNNGGGRTYLEWIKVDGKELIDSNATPPNVPSIASTCRANQTAGISITSFTGNGSANQTVAHNLNAKPSLVIYKDRDAATAWRVIPTFINDGHYLALNDTNEIVTTSGSYFGTNTSSVLGITGSNSGIINASGNNILALAFSPVEGFSAFGTYEGNNNSDGPFLYTGFRPAFFLVKNVDAAQTWNIYDSSRDIDNAVTKGLQPNNSNVEYSTTDRCDFLSNGIKIKSSGGTVPNLSGNTYIYAAFAEHPFKTARAR